MARYSDVKKNFWITREEDNKLKEKPDDEFFKIYADLSNAQNNLNQIARKLNQGNFIPREKIDNCISTLANLSRALLRKYC